MTSRALAETRVRAGRVRTRKRRKEGELVVRLVKVGRSEKGGLATKAIVRTSFGLRFASADGNGGIFPQWVGGRLLGHGTVRTVPLNGTAFFEDERAIFFDIRELILLLLQYYWC